MKMTKLFSLLATLVCATTLSATTLQSLVTNEHKDGDVIIVPNGTYEPSNLVTETRQLTFRAETDGGVIIDGGNTARCVDLSDSIILEGFVLQNGKADRGGGVRGGAIIRTTIQNCSATFGGGSYQTRAYVSTYKGNTAEFFGMAAYGGTVFSCRVEGNKAATYGDGMGALFGVTVANTSVTGNTALRDNAGLLVSSAQNMVYYANVAQRGLYQGAPMTSANSFGAGSADLKELVDQDIFTNAAIGDYTLDVNKATSLIKDKGDSALGGHYDELWHDTDLSGRPRILGETIDLGPYEIADTFTVTCNVVGVGSATVSPNFIQEGDPVTLTAQQDANYAREFLGFYVNGELISIEASCTYNPVSTDKIEARFAGLSATTDTLAEVLTQLHPTIREEVKLADGAYTINGLTKPVAFVGASIGGTTITLSDDCKGSFFINATVTGAASNATLHRSVASNFSGSALTLTSSIITSDCGAMSGTAVNVTAYTTMPTGLTCTDCVTLPSTANTVAGAILPKGDAYIDAGQGSALTPYDALDIAGRPRKMGLAIDRGAHECHYITLTVEAEGYYQTLSPAVGTDEKLAGETLVLAGESPRTFKGWTLGDGTVVSETLNGTYMLPEKDVTLTAVFAGFTMNPENTVPENTQAGDTITLAPGTYTQDFTTAAKIVGTGKQDEVILTGSITNATLEAVTLQGATLSDVTLNRCFVEGGTITNGTAYNSILVNVTSATGTYINNTTVNTTLPNTAKNTRATTVDNYTPTQEEADKGAFLTVDERNALGDADYYGNPRVNNGAIDAGAVEYMWSPYVVTINVIGHGLVEPRGAVEVVRGETLTFTVAEDPKHPRGTPTVTGATFVDGVCTITPTADCVVTVTFPGLTVESDDDLAAVVADAQDGETITVEPGTYGAIDVKGKRLKIVASSSNPYDTIIDAQGLKRAVKLADGAEIIGFTIQNGLSNEGAGVYGGTVRRSVIRWNKLTYNGFGAGVCNTFAESCLIVDNGSTTVERSNGGGAANSELLNCTVVRNVADKGAGLYDCTAKNAVIALNVDLAGATSDWTGDSVEPDPTDCCTPTTGGVAVDAANLFVDAANNDWRLREGVACVDKGAEDNRLSATDLTGEERIYGDAVDMGAIEWNAPERKVKISLIGRGIATVSYTKNGVTTTEEVMWGNTGILSVPRDINTLTLSWMEDTAAASVERTLKGITANGIMIANSANAVNSPISWTLVTRDTVNVDLVFEAEELTVNTDDALTAALASAIPGETIHVAAGTYTVKVTVGAGVTLDGGKVATLKGGVTLADGAVLKNMTVTTNTIEGPESGAATVLHSVVTEVNGTAIYRNVIVKTSLIHNNRGSGVRDATVYLSTITNNLGQGVMGISKCYGSIISNNGADVDSTVTVVDSYVGGSPRFVLPAPDGDDYTLMSSSPAIDAAKTAQWEGFTDADRALTDLAGNSRPRLGGFDAGAYEVQGDETAATTWTWYGSDYSMDGNVGGASWRKTAYGAPCVVPTGENVYIGDRPGYLDATLFVDRLSSFGNVSIGNVKTDLRIADAGGTWDIVSLASKSTKGALTLAAKMNIASAFNQSAGSLAIEEGAKITLGGAVTATNIPVMQTGGTLTVNHENVNLSGTTTYTLVDGILNVGDTLNLRDTATLTIDGGELNGTEISIAQGEGRTPLKIYGGNITLNRLETGDTSGARHGNVEQMGGTVTLTGSNSGKQAPLHISHWPGSSTYTLRGGELYVPNGEVRLGQDGDGTLRLEGGVARLKSVAISNGRVQLAGGTYEALAAATTLTAEVLEGTISTVIACPGDATGLTLTLSGTGTVNLSKGSYRGDITDQHVMLGEKVYFYGTIDHSDGEKILTLPGHAYANIQGGYKPGKIALSSEPPLNVRTAILGVTDYTNETNFTANDIELVGMWASCCTLEVVKSGIGTAIYVTRTGNPTTSDGVGTPILTVDGDTLWSDATKWSGIFTNGSDAIVRVVSSGTLNIDTATQTVVRTLTFDVPEGVTLNVSATDWPYADEIKKTGLGTLKWNTLFSYDIFNEGEGTFIAAASGQTFTGKAFETMAFRAEANVTLSGQSRMNATVIENCTLTLDTASVLDGSITMEHVDGANNGCIKANKAITFVGDFITNQDAMVKIIGAFTFAGDSTFRSSSFAVEGDVRIGGNVNILSLPGNGVLGPLSPGLKILDIGGNDIAMDNAHIGFLNNQWPDGATKVGAGTLTFPAGYGFGGSAAFSGLVVFTESLVAPGSLHFKPDAVVTIPYGRTLTANDEIRVEAGARFIITNPPTELDSDVLVKDFLISKKTAGLRVDQLASVSLAWGSAPNVTISNPIPSLNGDTLQYTITRSTMKTWTGATSSDWSTAGNWSAAFEDGDAVLFTSRPAQKTVTLSKSVSPSQMTIQSGAYTFTGGANLYAFEGKPMITQYEDSGEDPGATWQTFFTHGSYMLHGGATAKIALDGWTYAGSFSGSGAVQITEGRFALTSASNGFIGSMTVDAGATLRLCHEHALYNASVTLKGALSVESPTSLATLVANDGTISLAPDKPLEVRDSLLGNSINVVTDIVEAGDWTLLTYPASTQTEFTLENTPPADAGLVASLTKTSTALILSVRSNENIAWSEKRTVDGLTKDIWVVDGTTVEIATTTNKHLNFHDVEDVDAVTVVLPADARSLTVTAQQTQYTLTGSLTDAPITVEKGAEFILATSTTKPTAVENEGVIVVTGMLDLTETDLLGYGQYVAGTGGVIRISARVLAEATATFVRNGGQIIVVADEDFSLSNNNLPTFIKEGEGTLYMSPTAMTQPITINAGSVAPNGGMALKARYFKFEALERFNQSLGNGVATSLSDFVMIRDGQRQSWPEGSSIVRFDSGSTHSILVGIEDDAQKKVNATGSLENLLDNDPRTELSWGEWHAIYCAGGEHERNYFVVDAGPEGMLFTGYNVGTPASLSSFFRRWTISVANDISDWRPALRATTVSENENQVWQLIDERTLSQSTAGLTESSWVTPNGYSASRASGFWSRYSAPITLGATGTLDLTKAVGTSGILQDEVEIVSVTGEGTVTMPTSLKVTADTFTVGTLKLVGSTTLRAPMTVNTTVAIANIVVSESVAAAYNNALSTTHVLIEGYTGALPMLQGMTPPSDGGTWALRLEDGTLSLVLKDSMRELYATLTEDESAWDDLTWCDALDKQVDNIDWSKVQTVRLNVTEASPEVVTVTLENDVNLSMNATLNVDFGTTQHKTVALNGTGVLKVSAIKLVANDTKTAYGRLYLQSAGLIPEQAEAIQVKDSMILSIASAEVFAGQTQLNLATTRFVGNGTLEIAAPDGSVQMIGFGGDFTGNILVTDGTLVFPTSGSTGPGYNRVVTVKGETAALATGTNQDATGWNYTANQKLVLTEGGAFKVYKRDTFRTPLEMIGGKVLLMPGSTDDGRGLDWFQGNTLTVKAATGATAEHPTESWFSKGASNASITDSTMQLRDNALQVTVEENARLNMEVSLAGQALTKTGLGELVLASPSNTTELLTVEKGILTVMGTTSTGATVMMTGTVLRGTGVIAGPLSLYGSAILEVDNATDPLEVRGALPQHPMYPTKSYLYIRLSDEIARLNTAIPLISAPNLAEADQSNVEIVLADKPANTRLEWVNRILYLVPESMSSSVTEVKATVTGDANWSALSWTDMSGTAVTPDWRFVTAATLTVTADATLTRDVATLALASLTLTESEHTLTLEGAPLPSTLTTLAANTEIIFGDGVLSMIPTNLSGTKNLTFTSTVTSSASGGDTTFAYDNFTGNWIVESGATLNMNGDGGRKGVMKTSGAESGIITVKQGATINLNGNHVFGWADTAAQGNRTVLVVDGGHVEVGTNNQYIRRTFEFKNGATMHAANNTIQQSRGGVIKVTEGEATFSGNFAFGCDSNGGSTNAQWIISEGACLNVPAVIQNGTNNNAYALVISGGGTAVLSGANTYSLHETQVEADTTLLVNGTHRYAKPYIIRTNATLGGSGSLVSTSDNNCSVTFEDGAKLAIVNKDDPLSIQVGANANLTFNGHVSVTPPASVTMGNPAKLLKSNVAITVNNFYLTESTGYTLSVTQDSSGYTLLCNRDERDSYSELVADVTGEVAWDSIVWKTPEGTAIDSNTINWTSTETITFRVSNTVTVQIPDNLRETFTRLETLQVAYVTTDATLTLAGNTVSLPTVHVASGTGSLTSSATSLGIETLTAATASVGMDLSVCGSVTTLPETLAYTLIGNGTLGRVLPGATDVTIASGTVTMGAAGQLANRRVIVKSGATLDVKGYAQPVSITLAGGTLTNTGAALSDQSAWQTYNITLTADSTISGSADIRSLATNWAGNTINLNGRTLTLDNSATVYLTNPTLNNGTIVVAAGTLDIGYGWDAANSWAQKDATSTLNNVTIQANGGSVIFNRNMAMEGSVVLGEGVKLKDGVALTESATTRLMLSANAFNGAATLMARDITLSAKTLPTRYPAVNCTTLTLADDYNALIAASEAMRVQLATVSGDAPTVNNLPAGRTALVEDGVLYAAIPMSDLKAEVTGEQSLASLAWKNAETDEAIDYANVIKQAVTSMTLTVTGDTQLALSNLKADFPRLTTLDIVYGTANATLTFVGDATTLPTVSITGEAGALATSTTLAIDALMVEQDTFTFDVNALNAVTSIAKMPSTSTTLVGDATLTAQLPVSGRLTANGDMTIASALEGPVALTVSEGKTLTLSGSNSYTGATTIPSGATLVLTKEGALATGSTYKGAGTLSCSGFLPKGITSSLTANTWTGTVVITGTITLADQNTSFEALGHTNSKLVIDGNLTGYLKNNGVCEVPVELNGSLTNNNGYSNNSYVFKKLSGTGSFTHNKDLPYAFIFEDVSEFEGAITVSADQARVVVGGTADVENGKIVVAGNAKIASGKTWSATNGITIKSVATIGGEGTLDSAVTFEDGATLDLTKGVLTATNTVNFGATLKLAVDGEVELDNLMVLKKQDANITEAVDIAGMKVAINGGEATYSLMQTSEGYALRAKTIVTTLTATAGQSLSDVFNSADSILDANATLVINFGDVEGDTAVPGKFTFDNANDITFASITITGSNGGTLTKTGTGAVAATTTTITSAVVTVPEETVALGTVTINEGTKLVVSDATTLSAATIESGATLKVTTKDALTNFLTSDKLALGSTSLKGAGTLELAFADAETILEMTGNGGTFSGDIIVSGGTLKFPNDSGGSGPGYGRVITVTGANAALATGTNTDATGWNVTNDQKLVLADGAEFKVYKRDTFTTPLEMTGATIRLMVDARQGDNYGTRAFDWYQSPTLKVFAASNATVANPTISYITVETVETPNVEDQTMWLREGATLPVTIAGNAVLQIDARVASTGNIVKDGDGELVLAYAENTYTGTTTINVGTLTVTGSTGTGTTTMAAGTTLRGTGTIGGALTFTEGATLVVDPNATTPLMVNGVISGVAQLSFTGEVIQRTAVIASAQTIQTSSFVPPAGYTFAVETVDDVNTLYLTPAPITELVANLSGEMAWEDIEWMTPEGATVDISTIEVSQVATLTLNLEADAQLTFVDDVTEIFPALTQIYVDSELASDVALTVRGGAVTLPAVKVATHYAPMSFRSEATSLTVAKFQPFIMVDYGLGIDVAFMNSCTDLQLPSTYRLFGDGVVKKTLSGGARIAQGKVTVGNELSSVTALSIESGATLKVTTKVALTNFLTSNQLALNSTELRGAGTLELAFADAETILEMTGNGGNFTGDILVSIGTLKFPNGGQNGPGQNRVITVTGANAVLATGTNNDATGYSVAGRQSIVLTEQGEFKVYKRDTLKTPITMAGGIIRLMETAEDSGRGLDWFNSPKLTVNALEGASVASPTDSYITYVDGAAGATIKMNIRDGSFPVEVNEKARLVVDAHLYGGALTKTGAGELVLTNAENSYGATTINAGTFTVTGATGTGATTMAVGTTLRGTGTVKGDLTFTNTTETVEEVTTITGWPTFEVDVTTGAAPLTVTGSITGVAKLAFTGDTASLASIPVVISTQESVADSFEGIPDGFTFTKVDNMHILVNANAQEYTALYAKVAGDTKWSQLTWTTDAEGTEIVTTPIAWDLVEFVTLTAEANATVTRDVTTAALASLTVMDSEYTLTLVGYALPATSTLVVDGALCLGEGVVTMMPNLRGAGTLTFMGGEIISTRAGSNGTNYAYNDFTGRWILENGTTMRIRGVGDQKGQLNWNSTVEGSGQIEVRQGARLVLEAQNVFGWGAVNELHQRKVLVVDGGEVEISTAENYIRRTIELKNGATLACPATNSIVYFSRGATIEVTEGEATITGTLNISCDNAGSSVGKGATIRVDEGATLNLPGSIAYGKNGNTFALTYTGGGTVNVTGENSYHTYTETIVDEGMTFIMNGTHIASGENTLKPYTFKAGATLMGAGTIKAAVTFNEGAVVVADGQALTLGTVTAETTFVEVTATLDTAGAEATVFTATNDFDATKFITLAAYVLEKTPITVDETTTYVLVVKRASTVTVTGTDDFDVTTQQVLSELVIDALMADGITSGTYAVNVEVYTKGSETPVTPTADEVDALLGCFINVESVEVDTENNTATVKIDYEFGITSIAIESLTTSNGVPANGLYIILTAEVESSNAYADYADGTRLIVTLDDVDISSEVTVVEETQGVMKLAIPYEETQVDNLTNSQTFQFEVKATNSLVNE